MPELPEVEVIRNGIATCLIAQRVERVIVRTARLRWPIPPQLGLLMPGEIIQDVARRFGALLWHPRNAGDILLHPRLSSIGVEPLSAAFHGVHLYQHTRARQISIKQALLSGKIVAGVGNIYACESLFRAGIHPAKTA